MPCRREKCSPRQETEGSRKMVNREVMAEVAEVLTEGGYQFSYEELEKSIGGVAKKSEPKPQTVEEAALALVASLTKAGYIPSGLVGSLSAEPVLVVVAK
jgi:hypothetical protein